MSYRMNNVKTSTISCSLSYIAGKIQSFIINAFILSLSFGWLIIREIFIKQTYFTFYLPIIRTI